MTTTVRTTTLEVYVHDGADWQYDRTAFAVSCSFGYDQRYAEATVRRTGGGEVAVNYWSPVEVRMGTTPGEGAAVRFRGYVIPVDNELFPLEGVLVCRGWLYRAQWVRNQTPGGTDLSSAAGVSDEAQVQAVLTACGVPFTAANIAGTGKDLGSVFRPDPDDPLTPGPFVWAEGEPGLSPIERPDEVSVPDTFDGRYRTFETLGGDVFRIKLATTPTATPDFTFTEGVDVLEARITRDPEGAANRVTVTGAPLSRTGGAPGVLGAHTFTAGSESAPYLPPGLPDGPDGWPAVTMSFSSPLIEKTLIDESGGGGGTGAAGHLYGASTPAFAPTYAEGGANEYGVHFSASEALRLVAVRWYRVNGVQLTPGSWRLWDTTDTSAPVWTEMAPTAWADTVLGWKEHPLPGATGPLLVAGRTYALGYTANNPTTQAAYTPVPDAPLTFVAHAASGSAGGFPAAGGSTAYGIDVGLGDPAPTDPGDVISCEAVAKFLLTEYNCVLDVLEFSTPRDDLLGPGQTIHLHSPRLGITDADQHYWLQRLEITLDERGAFTQRLTCVRKS